MCRLPIFAILVSALVAVSSPACIALANPLPLVKDGRPAAAILVPDEPDPVAFEAANELSRVIEKATGARLLVYPESDLFRLQDKGYPVSQATIVLVGAGKKARELGVDVSKLPAEGFAIKTSGNFLILAGRDDKHSDWGWRGQRNPKYTRGTWHAVCTFLEDYLGVRWLWPGDLGEVVPSVEDFSVSSIDRTDAPVLKSRALRACHFYGGDWHNNAVNLGLDPAAQFALSQELDRWCDHQRLGASFAVEATEFDNTWLEKYAADHPDWFALQPDGKRLLTFSGGYRVQMCMSNPQVIDEVVGRIVDYLDTHPEVDGYGVWPSDINAQFCSCENCKKWGPTTSDLVAHYFAEVGKKVAALRPGKYVSALAYERYNAPPTTDIKFGDNVLLDYVGQDYFGYLSDKVHKNSVEPYAAWSKVARHIRWRPNNFCTFGVGAPRVYVKKLAQDFKTFASSGMMAVDFDRLAPHWAMDGLNYYAAARLAWKPDTPASEIVEEYCEKGFGPAASAVKAYFLELESITSSIATARSGHDTEEPIDEVPGMFTDADIAKLEACLSKAKDAAKGDATVSARVAFLQEGLDFAEIESALRRGVAAAQRKKPVDAQIDEYRKLLDRRKELCKSNTASWAVDVSTLNSQQKWLEEQLYVTPVPGAFDDLSNAYNKIMDLPEVWKFRTDPKGAGEKEKWYSLPLPPAGEGRGEGSAWTDIRITDWWENQGYKDFDGFGWYRVTVKLPADLAGKPVQLCFGAADETAKVWVNGQLAGEHDIGPSGWDKRFFIDISKQMKPGQENQITVRVYDSSRAGGLWKPVKVVVPKTVLTPTKDAWIRRGFADAYGLQPGLPVGARDYFRSVVAWQLPDKAKIKSAKLILTPRLSTGHVRFTVHKMWEDWYEPKVTWNARDGVSEWSYSEPGAGHSLETYSLGQIPVDPLSEEQARNQPPVSLDITRAVREIVSGTRDNNGFILAQCDPLSDAYVEFYSREEKDESLRPRLELEYE